ncbi:MAG: tRNA (adenosine(37)-N6)-threonylcarbamoyltransferase complex ATPase subunit type 1 TsaE [Planctomycetes bacterium]|nr:tRNA (adenosine(37)-N6)-threonylcarbamoyltransferase complex ATPase subunit type 1 TsaE [Planctomycetota bacterium]
MASPVEYISHSVEQTRALGARLGRILTGGEVIALIGPLGAGKTQWVKGLSNGAGVTDPDVVNSPTFVLVNEYAGRVYIHHLDAYRLAGPAELGALGFDEMIDSGSTVIVEWADRVISILPEDRLTVTLEIAGPTERRIRGVANGPTSSRLLCVWENR